MKRLALYRGVVVPFWIAAWFGLTALAPVCRLSAQTVFTWSGAASGNTDFSNGTNWAGTAPTPTANDSLLFSGTSNLTATDDFAGNYAVTNITFASGASAYTIAPVTSASTNVIALTAPGGFTPEIIDSATSVETVSTNINFGSGSATFDVTSSTGELILTGNLNGGHSANFPGPGTVYLDGGNNSFSSSGGCNVNGGTLEVSATTLATTQPLGATNRPLNLDGGTLSLDGGASTYSIPNYITTNATSTILVGNSTEGLNVTSTNTSIGIGVGNTTTAATLNVDLATGSTFTVNGPVGNSGVASGGGNGTIELGTSTGTFRWNNTGSTTGIGAPNVTFDLGTGTASMNSGNTQSGKISLGALEGGANTNLYGDTKVADAVTYQIGNNSLTATAIFSGNINNQAPTANTTAVTKIGPATEELLGSGNYTGITTISNGTLAVGTLSAGGSNSSIGASPNAATNLVINGGTLQYLGSGSTTDRLFTIGLGNATLDASGTGAVSFTNPGALAFATPTVSQPFSLTLAGNSTAGNVLASVIADQNTGAGNVTNVNKEGAGVWNLTGVSTYTGTTNVNAGQLILLGGTLFSTNSVNINSGGTFGGNGTVSAGVVTLGNGGTIYAGLGFGDATLTLPNLTWTGGGNIEVGAVDGVGSDNISLGGGALTSAGSGNYDVDFEGVTFDTPDDYTLISYGSETGFTASDFSAEDVNFGPGLSGSFNLTTSGAGNLTFDVIAVPEPAMEALLAGGVIFLIGFRRRRAVV